MLTKIHRLLTNAATYSPDSGWFSLIASRNVSFASSSFRCDKTGGGSASHFSALSSFSLPFSFFHFSLSLLSFSVFSLSSLSFSLCLSLSHTHTLIFLSSFSLLLTHSSTCSLSHSFTFVSLILSLISLLLSHSFTLFSLSSYIIFPLPFPLSLSLLHLTSSCRSITSSLSFSPFLQF